MSFPAHWKEMVIPVTRLMSLNDRSTGGPYIFKSEGLYTQQQIEQIISIELPEAFLLFKT